MKFKIAVDPELHDEFVQSHPLGTLLQSSDWAKLKSSWGHEIISVLNDEDQIIASALLLIKQMPLGKTMIYCPRGPIMDYDNKELVAFFFKSLKSFAKSKRAVFVKFDPMFLHQATLPDGSVEEDEAVPKFMATLAQSGAKFQGFSETMQETIQPRFNAVIASANFKEEAFSKKLKQFLNKAKKSRLIVEIDGVRLLADFENIMKMTESRKNISLRNKDYYKSLLETYPNTSEITMIYMDMTALLSDVSDALAKSEQQLSESGSGKKQKNYQAEVTRLKKEKQKLEDLRQQFGDRPAIAGNLTVSFGQQTESLYAGMNNAFNAYHPSYLVWQTSISQAFEKGYSRYNMGGLENSLSNEDGLFSFKQRFLPTVEEYVGEFNMPVNSLLYPLVNFAYKKRKNRHSN